MVFLHQLCFAQQFSHRTSFGNVKGGKGVTNTSLNILNSYYIAKLLDVTIVNVNLVKNIIFYVASSIGEYEIVDVYSPMKTFFFIIYFFNRKNRWFK